MNAPTETAPQNPADTLAQELATYEALKPELLTWAEGRYALIKGDRLYDVFYDERDALRAGYREFGPVSFLIQKIEAVERPIFVGGALFGR